MSERKCASKTYTSVSTSTQTYNTTYQPNDKLMRGGNARIHKDTKYQHQIVCFC